MAHSVLSTRTLKPKRDSRTPLNQPLVPYMIKKPKATVMEGMTKGTITSDATNDFPGNERLARRYPRGRPMTTLSAADRNACQAVKRKSLRMYGSARRDRKRRSEEAE